MTATAQFAELFAGALRKLRTRWVVAWGESWHFSAHLDVSEVRRRLGLVGGTKSEVGVDERPGENTATAESRRRAASDLIESHDAVFRRTARRYSICADDAEDAYQRALEILLTKAPPIQGDPLVRWMQTVTKREALSVRRQRERLLGSPRPPGADSDADRDPLDFIASESPGPNDRLARRERVARSGEALQTLKPQEVRALTLKAQGYSYAEIGEITGWSYTKINRCMAEGRKRFLQAFADIEQGRRCEELAAALSELADGEVANGATDAVEFHLRSCAVCRAKLRAYRAVPGKVFDLLPGGPLLDQSMGGRPHEWIAERAAVALDKIRETGYSLLARGGGGGGGEATTLATAGGTRGAGVAAVAKVLAICGATAAGGATCVATGLVDPGAVGGGSASHHQAPAIHRPAEPTASVPAQEEEPPSAEQVAEHNVAASKESAPAAERPTPVEQKTRQFSFESSPAPSSSSGSGTSSDFGGPTGGGGGSGGGGGGSGGSGFGIEK
ncbi:MAG TPA: sigma-70 family RNA polymerase sigma factor [Gemmataceae bacterium]